MWHTKFVERSLVIATVFLAVSSAVAAPTLLAEFTQHTKWFSLNGAINGNLPPTVAFTFLLHDPVTATELNWTQQLSLDDVGKTFMAPTTVLDPFSAATLLPNTRVELHIGPEPSSPVVFGSPAAPDPQVFDLPWSTLYVGDVTGYQVTGIERLVDNVIDEWVPGAEGQYAYLGGAQRVRVYGALVPEPSAALLLLVGVAHLCLSSRPRRLSSPKSVPHRGKPR